MPCLQLVGTWVKHNFKNLVSEFLTCPRLVGTWVKHIFRNLVPQLWRVMLFVACHVLNVACHGVSKSIVSIISVSCRFTILRVSCPCHVVATLLAGYSSPTFWTRAAAGNAWTLWESRNVKSGIPKKEHQISTTKRGFGQNAGYLTSRHIQTKLGQ